MKNLICLIDFDGTISKTDSTTLMGLLHQPEMTNEYLERFRKKEIGVKAYICGILENLNITEDVFKESIQENMVMDSSFKRFHDAHIPYRIVSSGADKNIKYSLETISVSIDESFLYTNILSFDNQKAKLSMPYYDEINGVNKAYIIQKYRELGYTTIFIGDGPSDFMAAGIADYTFVITKSKLKTLCEENNIAFIEVRDFNDVIMQYKKLLENLEEICDVR